MNILLVDDDVFICAYLQHVLTTRGHRVVECSNGIEALSEIYSQPFDLAVVDVMMPEMDGIALVTRMKNSFPDMPVLGISGGEDCYSTGGGTYLDLISRAGANRVLEKPFDEPEFLQAIQEVTSTLIS